MKIQQMAEKPREKALMHGLAALSDTELLALIIESGSQKASAFELAMQILSRCGSISRLYDLSLADLVCLPGIKKARAMRILSCVELAKRMHRSNDVSSVLSSPRDIYNYLESELVNEKQEHFVALYLDTKRRVLRKKVIFIGGLDTSLVHPREVFKEALNMSAASIVVVHNHPSGDPTPSPEDLLVTHELVQTGKIMHIPILDHIVLGKRCFYSFKEAGILEKVP